MSQCTIAFSFTKFLSAHYLQYMIFQTRPCPRCLLFTGGVVDAVFQNCTLVERLWSVHRVRACGSYRCSIVPGLGEVVVKQIVTSKDNTVSSVGIVSDTASVVRHLNCTGDRDTRTV